MLQVHIKIFKQHVQSQGCKLLGFPLECISTFITFFPVIWIQKFNWQETLSNHLSHWTMLAKSTTVCHGQKREHTLILGRKLALSWGRGVREGVCSAPPYGSSPICLQCRFIDVNFPEMVLCPYQPPSIEITPIVWEVEGCSTVLLILRVVRDFLATFTAMYSYMSILGITLLDWLTVLTYGNNLL